MSQASQRSPSTSLDPADWKEVEAILDELFDLPESQVAAAVDRLCGHDDQLRRRIEGFLRADRDSGGMLDGAVEAYAETLLASDDSAPVRNGGEEDLSGRNFGPYEILRQIGRGGMGVVYEAFDDRLDRSVALKLLPREWSRDEATKARFLREARAASTLDHGNICTIHDLGESDDGRLFIVMSYYPGETLRAVLERGPLPFDQARQLARQVAAGLDAAHRAGIVHRDIKPANIILTAGGEAKILDFGIAQVEGAVGLTRTGTSPGTPAYMAPEQIRGESVGPPTDVWALGVVLYEMLSGQRPFQSAHDAGLIYQILEGQPSDIHGQVPGVPADLDQVIAKALAKDPEQRYASCQALRDDLERTATGLAIEGLPVAKRRASLGKWLPAAVLVVVLVTTLLVLAGRGWTGRSADSTTVVPSPVSTPMSTKSRLAVLPFDNLSADDSLNWLRQGMTQMLITDLAQSPELDILSGRRLRQALIGANEGDGADGLSLETLQMLAEMADVDAVVQGSYVRLGETLRVTFTVEKSTDGSILSGETFDGWGDEALFSLVDRMAHSIRNEYELVPVASQVPDIQQVTTTSVEAWRYYTEGVQLGAEGKRNEAVAMYEKSIEIDPDFALALSTLGALQNALGHGADGRRHTERAIALAERLPLHERFPVQAFHYASRWSTYPQAIETYQQGLEVYPEKLSWRANLARLYAYVERYEEAVAEFRQVIDVGSTHTGNYTEAANALAGLNRFEEGQELLERFVRSYPDRWLIHLGLGWHATEWGRYDAAATAFARAAELRPGDFFIAYGGWRLAVLTEDWDLARSRAAAMEAKTDPLARWLGAVARSRNAIYEGRFDDASAALGEAADRPQKDSFSAQARVWRAALWLDQGKAGEALAEAEVAQREGAGDWPELEALRIAAEAAQTLGDRDGADRRLEALRGHHARHPNRVEERQIHHLAGRLALLRGRLQDATRELELATALLPPRGVEFVWYVYPDHVPIWLARGQLEEAKGHPEAALGWYERCANSGSEHLERPTAYRRCGEALRRLKDG